jgi:NADPH:quinone reductase-like Zn-dependent oxidoreductase
VGTFAVQLAKAMGAHVTGVCSTRNISLVRDQMGADEVIDYTAQDVADITAGTQYDRIIDAVGRVPSVWRRLLKPDGVLIAVSLPSPESECVPCQLFRVMCFPCCCCCLCSQKFYTIIQEVKTADLKELTSMLEAGTLKPAIVLHLSGLSAIPDALSGHRKTSLKSR